MFFGGEHSATYQVLGNLFDNNTVTTLIASGTITGAGQTLVADNNQFTNNRPTNTKITAIIGIMRSSETAPYSTSISNSIFSGNSLQSIVAAQYETLSITGNNFQSNTAYCVFLDLLNMVALSSGSRIAYLNQNTFSEYVSVASDSLHALSLLYICILTYVVRVVVRVVVHSCV
jgi:hypothetical protein